MSDKVAVDQLVLHYKELKEEIHKVIIGQDEVVDQVLISISKAIMTELTMLMGTCIRMFMFP